MIEETRRWVMRDLRRERRQPRPAAAEDDQRPVRAVSRVPNRAMERRHLGSVYAATLLWQICRAGVHGVPRFATPAPPPDAAPRLAAAMPRASIPTHLSIEELIRFCAAFLDQGIAHWTLPDRDQGFFQSWVNLYRDSRPIDGWMRGLPAELRRIRSLGLGPAGSRLTMRLHRLGVADSQREEYLSQTLLALRGWAGMIWQMETNAEWTVHPAPPGTLVEYVAVRLILERLALAHVARDFLGDHGRSARAARPVARKTRRRAARQRRAAAPSSSFNWRRSWVEARNPASTSRRANGPTSSTRSKPFRLPSGGESIIWRSNGAFALRLLDGVIAQRAD